MAYIQFIGLFVARSELCTTIILVICESHKYMHSDWHTFNIKIIHKRGLLQMSLQATGSHTNRCNFAKKQKYKWKYIQVVNGKRDGLWAVHAKSLTIRCISTDLLFCCLLLLKLLLRMYVQRCRFIFIHLVVQFRCDMKVKYKWDCRVHWIDYALSPGGSLSCTFALKIQQIPSHTAYSWDLIFGLKFICCTIYS